MHRRETTLLLREIGECIDSTLISWVYLKNLNSSDLLSLDDYELHFSASLDSAARNRIKTLVKEHKLLLKESDDFVVIYSPKLHLIEMTA